MNMLKIVLTACLIVVFSPSTDCWAFRCGSGLVTTGDTKAQVLVTCGKPTSKEKACENSQEYTTAGKYGKIKKSRKCGKKVEIWHYNCGDLDFIYALTFKNGILIKETTEGRGKGSSDCGGK
jgi:hypothetical protein